jgi:hypothetical protein
MARPPSSSVKRENQKKRTMQRHWLTKLSRKRAAGFAFSESMQVAQCATPLLV